MAQDMTDEEFDRYVREEPWFIYRRFANRLTDEQFDYCVRDMPWRVLAFYNKFSDRVTDEQFAYCVYEKPWAVLKFYKKLDPCKLNRYYEQKGITMKTTDTQDLDTRELKFKEYDPDHNKLLLPSTTDFLSNKLSLDNVFEDQDEVPYTLKFDGRSEINSLFIVSCDCGHSQETSPHSEMSELADHFVFLHIYLILLILMVGLSFLNKDKSS